MHTREFHLVNYAVFSATIVVSIAIGIYHGLAGDRQGGTSEYLVGGGKMKFLPVAISLMVSYESSIMMLGVPAEGYVYGLQYVWCPLGYFLAILIAIPLIVPLLNPLKLTTAYEYLEIRFKSKLVRFLGIFLYVINVTFYMGVVLYGPAIALESVTGFPQWMSIVFIAGSAVLYTSIGGFKAVIWTDVFQFVVMITGIFAILITGTVLVGSPWRIWDIAEKGGRTIFFDFDPNPTTRHTFWSLFVGSIFRGFGFVFNQQTIQRISSTASVGEAKSMMAVTAPGFPIALILSAYEGVVAYAYYFDKKCDPLESGALADSNQIIPYLVLDFFESYQGLSGLFLAALFSACLSTLSSCLNSLSAIMFREIIKPSVGDMSEFKVTLITKLSVVVFGTVAIGIAFLVSHATGTLSAISLSIMGAFNGPLIGLFLLGCFFPRVHAKGALSGGLVALVFSTWISMGMNFSPNVKKTPYLPPAPIGQCLMTFNNTEELVTTGNSTDALSVYTESTGLEVLYNISYQWLDAVGAVTCMLVAVVVSGILGFNTPDDVDPQYLAPVCGSFHSNSSIKPSTSDSNNKLKKESKQTRGSETRETNNTVVVDMTEKAKQALKMTRD